MSRRIYFIDSWFFIARIDPQDDHHKKAERLAASLDTLSLLTHDAVLAEVLGFFSAQGSRLRARAVEVVRWTINDVEVVSSSGVVFQRGLDLYERRGDKQYSLVDCMSMALMKQRGISHVLTNDHHFRQEGFTVLSDAP